MSKGRKRKKKQIETPQYQDENGATPTNKTENPNKTKRRNAHENPLAVDLSRIDCSFDDNVYRNGFTFLFIWQVFPFGSASWNNEATGRPNTIFLKKYKINGEKQEKQHDR